MIHGTDWGAYLGPSKEINMPFKILLDAGLCDFFVCKGDQDDPENPFISTMKNLDAARAAGVPVVACYYWNFPGMSAQYQIDHYSEKVVKENPDFIAVDIEDETTGKSAHAISENAKYLCEGLRRNFPKKRVVPYTSWNYITRRAPEANTWLGEYDYWIASYIDYGLTPYDYSLAQIKGRPTKDEKPSLPDAWKYSPWKIWQFSSRMKPTGLEKPMDHLYDWNVFNGSLADMKAWITMEDKTKVTIDPVMVVTPVTDADLDLEKRLTKLEEWAKKQGFVP
jgi:GH25 family lysozyme M1 (1,4-beta-N-acetylmuramidase)